MVSIDRIAEPWCTRTPYGPGEEWPTRVDMHLEDGFTEAAVDAWVQSAGVSLDWEILAQTAQALKDRELLAVTKKCHPETLRQLRWANASLKVNSAQIMVTA